MYLQEWCLVYFVRGMLELLELLVSGALGLSLGAFHFAGVSGLLQLLVKGVRGIFPVDVLHCLL